MRLLPHAAVKLALPRPAPAPGTVRRLVILMLAGLLAGSVPAETVPADTSPDPRRPGTLRMVQRLKDLAAQVNVRRHIFLSREKIPLLREALAQAGDGPQALPLLYQLSTVLIDSNENEEALKVLARLEERRLASDPALSPENARNVLLNQGLAWLRIGELQNCLQGHNPDSCLAPIHNGGLHRNPEPSRRAIERLQTLLRTHPDDLGARWLLNIAAMTIGDYPDKVPAAFLIPPKAFASEYAMKPFPEVSGGTGLDVNELSGGAVVDDFDNDGLLDVMFTSIGFNDSMHFFRNNGDGTFTDRTGPAGLLGLTGGLGMVQADFNNDGFLDVLILRGGWMRSEGKFPVSLLKNLGDGTFEDVTEAAGIQHLAPTQTATWFDFDGDGWLDLFIGNESTVNPRQSHPCELYRNNHDGTFTECARECGVAYLGYVKGVVAGDFNNDGWPDLYLSVGGKPNVLFRNSGPQGKDTNGRPLVRFEDVAATAGVTEPLTSFPCWFFDYDNDGWEDIFVTGYKLAGGLGDFAAEALGLPHNAERARLYHNNGNGTFTDVSKEAGVYRLFHAMGANYGDLDNDGYLDFYLGTGDPDLATIVPNLMFRNDHGRRFQDVTASTGTGHLQKGHAVCFADLNNDGWQDIFHDLGGAVSGDVFPNALFANPGGTNHWITLRLQGTRDNRSALGARITVHLLTPAGPRKICRTVRSGGSFGASPLRQEIGLGDAASIARIEIFWPVAHQTQTLDHLQLDRFYTVRQGASHAEPENPRRFAYRTPSSVPHLVH